MKHIFTNNEDLKIFYFSCTATLKASDFTEVSRAMCQFITTSTILDNGTQVG